MHVPAEYHGREQSYLKHMVLRGYLGQWAHKLGSTARTGRTTRLWYVNTFAGPWKQRHPELRDTSIAIGLEELERAAATWRDRGVLVELAAVFVERDPSSFAELKEFLAKRGGSVPTHPFHGDFGTHAAKIVGLLGGDPAFVFVDPKGWKDAAMRYIAPLAAAGPRDVMINVMFDHLNRQKDRLIEHVREQMRDFFGLDDSDLPAGLSEDDVFRLYRTKLKEKCKLPYAADLVVPHPTIDRTKFHLVVGGKDKAVLQVFREVERAVMGEAAAKVRDEAVQREAEAATGQLQLLNAPPATDPMYDEIHARDAREVVNDVKSALKAGPRSFESLWPQILEERHLTVANLAKVIWRMFESGILLVPNRQPRERSIKPQHQLALKK